MFSKFSDQASGCISMHRRQVDKAIEKVGFWVCKNLAVNSLAVSTTWNHREFRVSKPLTASFLSRERWDSGDSGDSKCLISWGGWGGGWAP